MSGVWKVAEIIDVDWPEGREPTVQTSSPLTTLQLPPDEETNDSPDGNGSRMTTLEAAEGP
jgi:hypothetical protein